MGKIVKYEWRKQRTSRLIILFGLLIGLITFAINERIAFAVSIILMLCGLLVIFYTGIESLLVFNKDLRTKQSHMLWMLPKSVWEILGGKFLAAILQMLFVFAAFTTSGFACLTIAIAQSGRLKLLMQFIKNSARALLNADVDWKMLVQFMMLCFLSWTLVIMIGFLAIIISRTLFLNSRFSGLFSVILFFVINYIVERGSFFISKIFNVSALDLHPFILVYYAVVCAALFGISGVLADKKLSV